MPGTGCARRCGTRPAPATGNQPATQVAELAGLCDLRGAGWPRSHGIAFSTWPGSGQRPPATIDGRLGTGGAPMPFSLTALGRVRRLDDLDDLGDRAHQTGLASAPAGRPRPPRRPVGQRDLGIELQRGRLETALGQATLQRHLTAFEAHLVVAAGATSDPCDRDRRSCPGRSRCHDRRGDLACLAPSAGLMLLSSMINPSDDFHQVVDLVDHAAHRRRVLQFADAVQLAQTQATHGGAVRLLAPIGLRPA